MTKRTLTLRRESLAELTVDELGRVAGANVAASGLSCPLRDCLREPSYRICIETENCPTLWC